MDTEVGDRGRGACVLISSCDAYADLWDPFFTLFFRYWPDCPYPVFLISNEQAFGHERVRSLTVGPDLDWSSSFLKALAAISYDHVLVMMEDYLLVEHPDNKRLEQLLCYMKAMQVSCLRLFPVPGPQGTLPGRSDLGEITRGSPHRVSLQAAFWERRILLDLVKAGESAWDFETEGTKRSNRLPSTYLSVTDANLSPLRYLCTAVVRGRWVRPAIKLLEREDVAVDLSRREVESITRELLRTSRYRLEDVLWKVFLKRRRHHLTLDC